MGLRWERHIQEDERWSRIPICQHSIKIQPLTTHNHRCKIVCTVVVTAGACGFQRLLSSTVDLAFVDAIEVFVEDCCRAGVISNDNLDGSGLVEVERSMVAREGLASPSYSKREEKRTWSLPSQQAPNDRSPTTQGTPSTTQ